MSDLPGRPPLSTTPLRSAGMSGSLSTGSLSMSGSSPVGAAPPLPRGAGAPPATRPYAASPTSAVGDSPTTPGPRAASAASMSSPAGHGFTGAAAATAVGKNIAVSRKVQRLLDVTPSDGLDSALRYASEHAPECCDAALKAGRSSAAADAGARGNGTGRLRDVLAQRSLEQYKQLIDGFAVADAAFLQVEGAVQGLTKHAAEASKRLKATSEMTAVLRAEAARLKAEQDELKEQERRLADFTERFQLSQPEQAALQGGDVTGPLFLPALAKVQSIHQSCSELLAAEHQQAAVELLDSTYLTQVTAFERLRKYLAAAAGDAFAVDQPTPSLFFDEALAALSHNAALWAATVQDIARVRRSAVLRRYAAHQASVLQQATSRHNVASARSGGANGGLPAADQATSVQRLLSWLREAVDQETALLKPIFSAPGAAAAAAEVSLTDCLDTALEGAAGTFAAAVAQLTNECGQTAAAMVQQPLAWAGQASSWGRSGQSSGGAAGDLTPLLSLFTLEAALASASRDFTTIVGASAAITVRTSEAQLEAMRHLYDGLRVATTTACGAGTGSTSGPAGGTAIMAPANLTPSHGVLGLLRLLKQLCGVAEAQHQEQQQQFAKAAESRLHHSDTIAAIAVPTSEDREAEFAATLGAVLDPIWAATISADVSAAIPGAEQEQEENARTVFRINTLCSALSTILPFAFTATRQDKLTTLLEAEVLRYVEMNTEALTRKLGFSERLMELRSHPTSPSTAAAPATIPAPPSTSSLSPPSTPSAGALNQRHEAALHDTLRAFYTCVYNAGALPISMIDSIQLLRVRDRCRRDVTSKICVVYKSLHETVVAKMFGGDAEAAKETLYHTPEKLRVLLDVDAHETTEDNVDEAPPQSP